jgi:hypothetical protein
MSVLLNSLKEYLLIEISFKNVEINAFVNLQISGLFHFQFLEVKMAHRVVVIQM